MNYQIVLDEILKEISSLNKKPKLLLHVCCAPCSSYVLEYLNEYFDITVYYYNPNISSYSEYEKRLNEEIRFVSEYPFNKDIPVIKAPYDNDRFEEMIKGLEEEKEGGARCFKCYRLRLEKSYQYAQANNFGFIPLLVISFKVLSKII